MTVSATTSSETFDCDGATFVFTAPFRVLSDAELQVFLFTIATGVTTELVQGVEFSVSSSGGVNTTFQTVSVYSNAYRIRAKRNTTATQEVDYRANDPFPAESHEEALDRLTMLAQEARETDDRSIRVPDGETIAELPPAADRALRMLGFTATGALSVSAPSDGSAASLALSLAGVSLTTEGAGMSGNGPNLEYPIGTAGHWINRVLTDFNVFRWIPPAEWADILDGTTTYDSSAAWTSAITAAAAAGRPAVVSCPSGVYKIASIIGPFTCSNVTIDLNGSRLDFSSVATASAKYIEITGTKGSAVSLTANTAADAVTVAVGTTAAFSAEGWAWMQSTAVWASIDSTVYGQYVKVKSVDSSTQLTLYAGPIVPFNTADSASISPVSPAQNIKITNGTILGSGANSQTGVYISYGLDCVVDKTVTITDCENAGLVFWRGINCKSAPTVLRARAVGLSYGIGLYGGCIGCAVDGGYGEDIRHYVTVGDNDGINMHCRATKNVVMYARSAGIDSHAASFDFIAEGNQIILANGAGAEGITLQGLNCQAIGNTIRNVTGVGIYMQPLVTASGYKTKNTARGNHVHLASNVAGTPIGIYFQNNATTGTDWEAGDMDGNFVYGGAGSTGSIHFYILANRSSGVMKNITVRGNVSVDVALSQSLYIRALATSSAIENVIASANHFKTSGNRAVYVIAEGTTSTVDDVILTSNTIEGGSTANIGVVGSAGAVSNVLEDNNIFSGGTELFVVTGTLAGLKFKSARHVPAITISAGTGSTEPDSDWYIFDNAGTVTFTLPSASIYPGRQIDVRTIQAQAVNSASSNVVPRVGGAAGTAILAATDGAWATLKSDGTNWQIMSSS